jgi:hypothetical protein
MTQSRTLDISTAEKHERLCDISEEEIRLYLEKLIREERSSMLFRADPKYRKFVREAEKALNNHAVLHALTQ